MNNHKGIKYIHMYYTCIYVYMYVCYMSSHKVILYLSICSLFNWLEIDARNYSFYVAASAEPPTHPKYIEMSDKICS